MRGVPSGIQIYIASAPLNRRSLILGALYFHTTAGSYLSLKVVLLGGGRGYSLKIRVTVVASVTLIDNYMIYIELFLAACPCYIVK